MQQPFCHHMEPKRTQWRGGERSNPDDQFEPQDPASHGEQLHYENSQLRGQVVPSFVFKSFQMGFDHLPLKERKKKKKS